MSTKKKEIRFAWLAREVDGLSASRRAVLVEIAQFTNEVGTAFPSVKRLAQATGYCTDTVGRAAKELESSGLLRRINRRPIEGKNGFIFAFVPPIRLLIESGRLCVAQDTDTESVHNYKLELLKELDGTRQAAFQDRIYSALKDVIDLRSDKKLFSLYPVIESLGHHDGEGAVQRMQRLIESAHLFKTSSRRAVAINSGPLPERICSGGP